MTSAQPTESTDVLLVGAGIMSATLATILKDLQPDWDMTILERLDRAGLESSNAWNNAGTGHAALCELNYAPQAADGSVSAQKALNINEQYHVTRQLWSTLVENGVLKGASSFINPVPHISMVFGEDHADYLRARYDSFKQNKLFERMEFSEDRDQIADWAPLTMHGRGAGRVAATFAPEGTDVDFGALTNQLIDHVASKGATVRYGQQVTTLNRQSDGSWLVKVEDRLNSDNNRIIHAKFVFLGAGGGALHLLQKSGIKEAKGFGGFPVSGAFLRCTNPELIDQHSAKVYGKAAVGAPPMSVPHLDTRVIGNKPGLLFGPYAGWSPKFLKQGRVTDLPGSVKPNNILSMLGVGVSELGLVKYLVSELAKNEAGRIWDLREFAPKAQAQDWELITAGQRVQVIRRAKGKGGVLEFGTAVVAAEDGSIAGLLGASPGASTAVPAMLDVLERCFPTEFQGWKGKLREMVPSIGVKLTDNEGLFNQVWDWSSKVLELDSAGASESAPVADTVATV